MAKDKAKKPEAGRQKGGTKSSRWSERTKANKKRGIASRENRLVRAAERREKGATVTIPLNAMVPNRDGLKDAHGEIVMVPHKQRGKTVKSATTRDKREIQAGRIARKAEQRRNFSKLSPAEKAAHREAGRRQFASAVS